MINPLTPGAFCKKCSFLTFWWFLAGSQPNISFNLADNAFATQQLAFLAIGILFYISTRAWTETKILRIFDKKVTHVFFGFSIFGTFFRLSFFSFSFLFAAVIALQLGLLSVKKLLRKHNRDRQFLPWSSQV